MTERLDNLANTLHELTAIPALAGFEDPMIRRMRSEFDACGSPSVDPLGNVILKLSDAGSEAAPRVLVFAHMDELGFVVRKVERGGYLRVERLGGVPEKSMSGQRVLVGASDGTWLEGMVGTTSHHVTPQDRKYQVVPVGDAYVDLGFSSPDDVHEAGINVGSPVVYDRTFSRRGDRVLANTIDNRGGCAVLLSLIERMAVEPVAPEVWLVASVQEEYNLRGVLPAARSIAPDLAICLDVAISWDTPELWNESDVSLGAGPTIGTYSFHGRGTLAGVIPNPKLLSHFERVAADESIPLQRHVFFGGLTDASFLQFEDRGIPSVDIGFPCRYTHAPVESCDLRDLDQAALLVHRALSQMESLDLSRG